jgi:hypothetical protein
VFGEEEARGLTHMSLHETPMLHWYWSQVGGTLVPEFLAVPRGPTNAQRLLDGVIIRSGEKRIAHSREVSLVGQDVIVVQAKALRLGMYLMGQAVFSARLVERRFQPRSVLSVALVRYDDSVMRELLEAIPGMQVVVCPPEVFLPIQSRNVLEEKKAEQAASPKRPRE